jgi:general stress protein YciG
MDYEDQDMPRSRSSKRSGGRSTQARRVTERGTARRTSTHDTRMGRKKSRRGFAAMSAEQQREIARKGGLTVSRNRRHMADIGRIGGEHSHGGRRARARR